MMYSPSSFENPHEYIVLTIVRHGETIYNLDSLTNYDPDIPVPLTVRGVSQAEYAREICSGESFDHAFYSRLSRTRHTLNIITNNHPISLSCDARLDDRNTGVFEGHSVIDFWNAIASDPLHSRPEQGESIQDVKARVKPFLDELRASEYRHVLIVTHAIIFKILLLLVSGAEDSSIVTYSTPNGAVAQVILPRA